ncbi:MAG TPA: hypothetical protein VGL83_01170 [Stellaceae bacterium]
MRLFALLAVLLLGACNSLAPGSVDATQFRNAQGQVATGCGPMQGFAGPLQKAQQGCIDAWKSKSWTPVSG